MAVGDAECIGFSLGGAGGHISDGVVVDIFSIRKKFSCLLLADGGVPYTDFAMGKLGNVCNGSGSIVFRYFGIASGLTSCC